MSFSVSKMIVDSDQNVVVLNWSYSNADGSVNGKHTLAEPYGSMPVDQVNQATAVGWLESQLTNTPEEFDASIAATKARKEAEENQAVYECNDSGSFMPPAEPAQA